MHIIVLENQPTSQRGGQEIILLDVCRGLAQCGHKISLIYLEEGNLIEHYQKFCTHLIKVDSFLLDRSTISRSFNFFADIWRVPVYEDSVIYSNRYHDVVFGYLLAFIRKIPLVCYLQLPPHTQKFGRPHTVGLKGVDKFIALSQQTKLDWIDIGLKQQKIDVVHVGINPQIYQPADHSLLKKEWDISEDSRVVSYIGRLDKEKGIETLIKAFALLKKSHHNTQLVIAGRPVAHASVAEGEEYQKALVQLTIDLGIADHVKFIGHVSNPTSVYQMSDVTVLPSVWSEPFGRVIIESMACGTPVVASRTGGIPEILTAEFERELFEPGNEQALFEHLSQVVNWRDENPELGNRCREHILSNFSLNKMVDGIEKTLLSVQNAKDISDRTSIQRRIHN